MFANMPLYPKLVLRIKYFYIESNCCHLFSSLTLYPICMWCFQTRTL